MEHKDGHYTSNKFYFSLFAYGTHRPLLVSIPDKENLLTKRCAPVEGASAHVRSENLVSLNWFFDLLNLI
jgi:hypothetical protein